MVATETLLKFPWKVNKSLVFQKAYTTQKMKFSIKGFFNKCDQVRSFLWICSHLLQKYFMENFILWVMIHNENVQEKSMRNIKILVYSCIRLVVISFWIFTICINALNATHQRTAGAIWNIEPVSRKNVELANISKALFLAPNEIKL